MKPRAPYHLPPEKAEQLEKAKRLEWTTLFFMLTIIVVIYLTMGTSQAMKSALLEDILSMVPPIAFLVAVHFRDTPPNERFPYGYRRSLSIAFLTGAIALAGFGFYILYDSGMKLIQMEHPTVGMVELLGYRFWAGWLMIGALLYSAIPPFVLGRMKLPLSRELHEKVLYTDAKMNKADWMTALAAAGGVIGIGMGWWWTDPVAAIIIGLDVTKDGLSNLKEAVTDLMDEQPTKVEDDSQEPLIRQLRDMLEEPEWVAEASVRLREEGDIFTGEAFVVPKDEHNLLENLEELSDQIDSFDWRLHDVVIVPLRSLDSEPAQQ
ncbi:MAG: cation transporter [Chloroflexota bacterium]|nr:cation transporter [Chloroflexota bacterium]